MREQDDLYAVLGARRSATAEELRRAYRARARQWHPDTPGAPPDASARMARLNAAWHVLGDPARRAQYDARTAPPPRDVHARPVRPAMVPERAAPVPPYVPVLRVVSALSMVFALPAAIAGFVARIELLQRLAVLWFTVGVLGLALVFVSVVRAR